MNNSEMKESVFETQEIILPIKDICISGALRIRREVDQNELEQLARSMETVGQLQRIGIHPVNSDPKYELIFGERRLRAAVMLEWKTIKATIFDAKNENMILAISAAENLQREKYKTIENVEIIRRFKDSGFDNQVISKILFESLEWVADHEFVMRNSLARSIAEAGMLPDASCLKNFMKFPPVIRNMLMEIA